MRVRVFCIIISLISISSLAQKREIYLNDDLDEITQKEFEEGEDSLNLYNYQFEIKSGLDSIIVNANIQRIKKGKLSIKILNAIRTQLSVIAGVTIPEDNLIVINYYHGMDRCNSSGNKSYVAQKYKHYLRKLKRIENVSQFFMYKSPEGIKEYGKKIDWINDKFGTIEDIFFPLPYPCGSYVMIDDQGSYYVHKGEYNVARIIDLLKNQEETFDQNG